MELSTLTLFTNDEGTALFEDRAVEFRYSDHGMLSKSALISSPEPCRNFVFAELPVGFEKSDRFADLGRVAVCLSGRVRISAAGDTARELGPGEVFRLLPGPKSSHTISVVGDTPVHLMVLQTA